MLTGTPSWADDEEDFPPLDPNDPTAQLPIKGAYCPQCEGTVLLCIMPHAEVDKGSRRQFLDLAKEGYTIRILLKIEAIAPPSCECESRKAKKPAKSGRKQKEVADSES